MNINPLPEFRMDRACGLVNGKFSVCRSCLEGIASGDVRIKISYPEQIVQYATRSGFPSYFLHIECFINQPVDYIKQGRTAWKTWEPCPPFVLSKIKIDAKMKSPEASIEMLKAYSDDITIIK